MVQTYKDLGIVIAFRESCLGNESEVELCEIEYFDTLWLRVQHSLVTFSSSACFSQDSDVQKISRVAIPLFVVQNQLGIYHRHCAVVDILLDQLMEVLNSVDLEQCWDTYIELMLWAFMFAVYTSTDPAKRGWFLFELAKGVQERMIWRWEEVRKILQGFFYVDRLYEVDFRAICEEVSVLNNLSVHFGS